MLYLPALPLALFSSSWLSFRTEQNPHICLWHFRYISDTAAESISHIAELSTYVPRGVGGSEVGGWGGGDSLIGVRFVWWFLKSTIKPRLGFGWRRQWFWNCTPRGIEWKYITRWHWWWLHGYVCILWCCRILYGVCGDVWVEIVVRWWFDGRKCRWYRQLALWNAFGMRSKSVFFSQQSKLPSKGINIILDDQ